MNDLDNPYLAPQAEMSDAGGVNQAYTPTLYSWSGRIGRLRYLAYSLAFLIITSTFGGVASALGAAMLFGRAQGFGIVALLVLAFLPLATSFFVCMRRRLNDTNVSGWFSLLLFVPVAGLLLWLYVLFCPGTAGANNYGPAPSENTGAVIAGAVLTILLFAGAVTMFVVFPIYELSQLSISGRPR